MVYSYILSSRGSSLKDFSSEYKRFMNFECFDHHSVLALYSDLLKITYASSSDLLSYSAIQMFLNLVYLVAIGLLFVLNKY